MEVTAGERPVPGATPRHRAVLAYLLLNARTVLSADRLIDAVWGQTPPDTARAQIHAAVTAIRRVLRAAGAEGVLETRAAGYVAQPAPGQLDLDEFNALVTAAQAQGEGDPEAAAAQIRTALGLWRGEAFAGVNADYVATARARLEERRLTAIERLADIELTLGRHEALIDELGGPAAANPLRERLCGQLMLALHRAGRQADALTAGRSLRTALADQQGLDPGRAFVALEQAILRDDAGVATPRREAPVAEQAASIDFPEPRRERRGGSGRCFLPYDTPDLAGRTVELDRLVRSSADGVRVATVDGMAGIGKTALAVRAARRLADRYPDGQLFVDLHAHTAGHAPVEAEAALEHLLRQLGIPAERIPPSLTGRAELWRAELADRRVLAVLDNATDAEHVRPLLPGFTDSLVLVTSRRRLTGLDGVQTLSVDLLPARDAVELFTRIVGDRAHAEPIAVLDVLHLCGFLPLAVRIAAARLHHRPQWTVAYLADRLRDQRRRLAELSTADRSIASAFTLTYEQLPPDQQRMFRLLGLHPGHDIEPHVAAALADLPVHEAEELLENLLDAHAVLQREPGRYALHDLLREHSRSIAATEETDAAREAATARLLDHYVVTARAAVDLLFPHGRPQRRHIPELTAPAVPFHGPDDAAAWLDAERANLVAPLTDLAHRARPDHAGHLAAILRPYLDGHAHLSDAITVHTQALQAGRRVGDRDGEAGALIDLGWAYVRQCRYEQAYALSSEALKVCEEVGDRYGESRAYNTMGRVRARQREHDQAYRHLRKALEICREIGNRVGEAHVLDALGMVHEQQGRYDQARDDLQQALDLHRELGNRAGEALVLNGLGIVSRGQERYEQARDFHRQAQELYRELGSRSFEASALNGLGEAAHAAKDLSRAADEFEAALAMAEESGNRHEQARALAGLAGVDRALGRTRDARDHAERALDVYTELDLPEADDLRALLAELDAM
ncbi:tetratricopeptide repeat protein [Actinomadura barringtoniae]|uniref:Tetratricopeptide repeat protein n=1 Tax=Actinomadura barringtoniae TaxID=1427535 RepID=A0A939TB00_9ACTN|nr:tetratricopeptide repeat protein [Actinomadura barringtoniae]MBO2449620.1 tetratricopeptide repeat protein [Actinomadura barringtoniae]